MLNSFTTHNDKVQTGSPNKLFKAKKNLMPYFPYFIPWGPFQASLWLCIYPVRVCYWLTVYLDVCSRLCQALRMQRAHDEVSSPSARPLGNVATLCSFAHLESAGNNCIITPGCRCPRNSQCPYYSKTGITAKPGMFDFFFRSNPSSAAIPMIIFRSPNSGDLKVA